MNVDLDVESGTTVKPFPRAEPRTNVGLLIAALLSNGCFGSPDVLANGGQTRSVHSGAASQRPSEGQGAGSEGVGREGGVEGDVAPTPPPRACQGRVPASPLITNFSDATPAAPIPFGAAPNLTGGTFAYAAPGLNAPELALTAGANGTPALHVAVKPRSSSDVVSGHSGFGLRFDGCVDARSYDSIQFTLSGNLGNCRIRFAPTFEEKVNPKNEEGNACTLESCPPPVFPLTSSGTIRARFAELLGGRPGIIGAGSLSGLGWQMDAPSGSACAADFSIDDILFIDTGVPITADASGRVEAASNPLGVEGNWRVFGDSYAADGRPPGGCQAAGHAEDECSRADLPDSAVSGLPNVGGKMCTAGSTAQVLTVNGQLEYSSMWGIGMALSLADDGNGGPVGTFDASAHGVVGVSFEIDDVPRGLRVQFPTPSDPVRVGPDYWGAGEYYPDSPVQVGTNVVLFRDVRSPDPDAPAFDPTGLLQLAFLVSSNPARRTDFDYCISNLKLLVD